MFKLYISAFAMLGMTVFAFSAHEQNVGRESGEAPDEFNDFAESNRHEFESLIRFSPDAEPPFQLNESAAELLRKDNDKLADEALNAITKLMADLIAEYPDSPAARRVQQMIDESGQVLTRSGGLYPKGTFISGGMAIVR